MPTLSQSPLRRLAALRRVPFWAQALGLCALFAVAGVAALDDYGAGADEITQRRIAIANADYIATGSAERLYHIDYRYFGIAFEMPLLLVERALGLQDSRPIFLTRHMLTHLFFIAGGFACGMLAYRMLGSRWIALLAMLMFLLHPRLYAHSFFNSKDVPFAALLIITLYLARRAFRRDTVGAFLLCGIGVGLAINLRPFGLMLLPLMIAMRALDLWQAGRAERKHILLTSAAFLAAALATVYIIHPYYWENPLWFIESVSVMSQHPIMLRIPNLFMGEIYRSDAVPWNYIPVWFAITSPPVALALGALGAASICGQAITRPLAALRDRETRFRILLLGCFALPIVAVIALQSNIYNGWRHMYFLWAPFCLLAAVGLNRVANISMGRGIWKVGSRLPRWVRGCRRLQMARRALAYGVAGAGLITTLTAMAALHPYEHVYFNALVDTNTPGALGERYDMDYWRLSYLEAYRHLLERYPDDNPRVVIRDSNGIILPQDDRERLMIPKNRNSANYYVSYRQRGNPPDEPILYSVEAYGSVMAYLLAPKNWEAYRAAYDDVAANGTLLARADFDIYIHNGELHYLNADCEPLIADRRLDPRVFLHVVPVDPADLPADSHERGFENRGFRLVRQAAFLGGKCIVRRTLPDYPIARIATWYYEGEIVKWRADIELAAQALYEGIAAGDYGQPVARSDFDVYLRGGVLAYLKEDCDQRDVDGRFLLHIIPADPVDLPADGREYGYASMNFRFADHGGRAGDICAASRELPGYAIERIRTGQFVSGGGWLWDAEFPVGR